MSEAKQAFPCPNGCGNECGQDYTKKLVGNGNREFHGENQVSIMEGWHPSEVGEARRGLGRAGQYVQADGTVRFRSRLEQVEYAKAKRDLFKAIASDSVRPMDQDSRFC